MSEPEVLLTSGLESEGTLYQRLRYLSVEVQQQLQETERRYQEELEKRIHHNTLLSDVDRLSSDTKEVTCQTKHGGLRRYASLLALTSDNRTSNHSRPLEVSAPALGSSSDWKRPSRLLPDQTQQCERAASFKTTQQRKEEEEEAQCRKKFSALPVPSQVGQSLYWEMMEQRDKERKQGHERRKNFLLSVQRPFSFHEREKKKQDKLAALVTQVSQQANKTSSENVKQSSPKLLKETDQEEHFRKVHMNTTQREKPAAPGGPKLRTAERTRKEKLRFLDEKPSFQPKINHHVPDFSRLHKALQTEGLRKSPVKDVIRCQPFYLRTSALPARQRKQSPDKLQVSSSLNRSKSCGALASLSADTLPTYITDATRKRCMAIRMSMEMKDWKNQASDNWLRKYQIKSEAMRKTVSLHAKLLDPHKSLREVYDERLQHHRQADRQRTSDYMKDLQDMKARVRERPLLFEQVKQRNAKARAEQTYRNELKKAGVKEQFVEEKGGALKGTSISSTLEDDTTPDVHRTDNVFHGSDAEEENVDDGEEN
ncbi:protein FAM161B [Dunckerocampus dactyliophorus]|uniref:protein FAM161B n=1 Tax=Dunckerocampus dactyliophorus TaxID=161453 RepID=UPI0024074C2A|nr:protein FAM161B [Dunckerocampus dactyliophorus]